MSGRWMPAAVLVVVAVSATACGRRPVTVPSGWSGGEFSLELAGEYRVPGDRWLPARTSSRLAASRAS